MLLPFPSSCARFADGLRMLVLLTVFVACGTLRVLLLLGKAILSWAEAVISILICVCLPVRLCTAACRQGMFQFILGGATAPSLVLVRCTAVVGGAEVAWWRDVAWQYSVYTNDMRTNPKYEGPSPVVMLEVTF